jgi:hypothetical protein
MPDVNSAAEALKARAAQIDAAVEAAQGSNQERDATAEQPAKPAPSESVGTGTDNSDANKKALLQQLDAKIEAFRKLGKTDQVEKLQERRKALVNS